ncbi:MAG TPA: formylglycine-generating enzyme family protein, partial [Saprospiraceae bacterium]|nr:formylglycine-generating enzyme family protein [Saprospiraceae bacterium]
MRTHYALSPVVLPLLLLLPFYLQPAFPPLPDHMVLIKGGTFMMGDAKGEDDEKPVHKVTVSDFYLSKYEVTVAEFKAFVDATGYKTVAEEAGMSFVWTGYNWESKDDVDWRC